MSVSFSWNILTVTDVLGIILTALDFLGLTHKLEAAFAKLRHYCERYAQYKWLKNKRNWPPHKHVKEITLELIDTLPTVLLVLGILVFFSGYYEFIRDFLLGLSWIGIVLFCLGSVFALIFNAFFAQYVISKLIWGVVWSIEKLFMILGLPPKGVTGTIGLIVSLISFTLTHIVTLAP